MSLKELGIKNIIIVSNSKRQILNMGEFNYIYIPLTEEEKEMFNCIHLKNACFRIEKV